jgi:Sensors of blue-light using FAD
MLAHLAYVSKRTRACTDQEIEKILAKAIVNNPSLGITGVLLYTKEKFFQYVEGNYQTLTTLYDKIKGDPRHQQVGLLSLGPIKAKSFPQWHMGHKQLLSNQLEMLTGQSGPLEVQSLLSHQDEKVGQKLQHLLSTFFA